MYCKVFLLLFRLITQGKPLPKNAKRPLPVDVRLRSKTPLLKHTIVWYFVSRAWARNEMLDSQLRLKESLIRVPITSASANYFSKNNNRLHCFTAHISHAYQIYKKRNVDSARKVTAGSPFFDVKVTLLVSITSLHINTLAPPARSTRPI